MSLSIFRSTLRSHQMAPWLPTRWQSLQQTCSSRSITACVSKRPAKRSWSILSSTSRTRCLKTNARLCSRFSETSGPYIKVHRSMTTLATKPPIHQSSEAAHPTRTTIRRSTSSTAISETSSTKTLTWSQSMKITVAQSQWETPPGKCPLSIMAQSLHSITMANLNYSHLLARQWKLMVIKQVSPKKAWVHRRSLTASDFKMPIWPKRSMNVWGTSRVKSRPLSIPEYLTCTQARSTRIRNQGSTPWWSSSWSTWISSTRSARTACLSLARK